MINTKKLMECNAVVNCLMEYKPEITKEEVIKTEIFVMNRYENGSLLKWEDIDLEKHYFNKPDIIDYYLRANEDQDVIKITDFDELTEYLLKRYYSCNSNNDYDYTFLFDSLCKELFIVKLMENKVAKNIYFVNGNYYLYVDDYTFKHQGDIYLNYFNDEVARVELKLNSKKSIDKY